MFKQIRNSSEPKIIGVNNGIYQVEINKQSLKNNDNYNEIKELLLQTDVNVFLKNRQQIFELKVKELKGNLLKRAKLTDIMGYSDYFFGFKYIVSQKFVDCLLEVGVSKDEYYLIKIEIKNIAESYYLMFVPWVLISEINYSNSIIFKYIDEFEGTKKYYEINSYEKYQKLREDGFIYDFEKISISNKYQSNSIISIQGIPYVFFSETLIARLQAAKITSFELPDRQVKLAFG